MTKKYASPVLILYWLTGCTVISGAPLEEEPEDEEELEDDEEDELLDDELEEDDELLLEEEELEEDEELEDEEELLLLEDDDELEELLEDELELPPPVGANAATETAIWPELEDVQLVEAVPVAVRALVEPPPPLPETALLQRKVWPLPAVRVALEAPLTAASTSQELAVAAVTLAESVLAEVLVLMPAAVGAPETPLSETEPAAISLTAPPKVMETVWAPAAGLSR